MGPPVGGELDPHQIAVTLSISCAEEAISQRRHRQPSPLGTASQRHGRPRRPAVLVHTGFNEAHCILHTRSSGEFAMSGLPRLMLASI